MSDIKPITKKRGRPKEHEDITVSQVDSNAEYHRQYYHKVLKKGKVKSRQQIPIEESINEEEREWIRRKTPFW